MLEIHANQGGVKAMRVLVVGGGGREHALAWTIAASPLVERLFCAPGNPGIAAEAECAPVAADDVEGLAALARQERIDLVVVGPEAPLAAGLADRLRQSGIAVFGPSRAAARLESSKAFMKDLARRAGIPTAGFAVFEDARAAIAHIHAEGAPIVVKADGLAAGKGVVVAATVEEAEAAVRAAMIERAFGEAGARVVVEECLTGEEVSAFALADGERVLMLETAQDYKRVGEGDTGPNTGGMGSHSPAPSVTPGLAARIEHEIFLPAVRQMAADGIPYRGVLFAGLMIADGAPRLLEFNVRFGDPETQALMLRLRSDLLPALLAAAEGSLAHVDLRWSNEASVCVVMANRGYPGPYERGGSIAGLGDAPKGAVVFHAGTAAAADGGMLATGGRVLGVAASGGTRGEARALAYRGIDAIDWPGAFCRRDIARIDEQQEEHP